MLRGVGVRSSVWRLCLCVVSISVDVISAQKSSSLPAVHGLQNLGLQWIFCPTKGAKEAGAKYSVSRLSGRGKSVSGLRFLICSFGTS